MNNDFNSKPSDEDKNSKTDNLYPSVKNALIEIAKKEGYTCYNINKKIISSDGGNCFGVLYEINIKGETGEGKTQETNIFVKQAIPNGDNIKILSLSEIYSKEIFIYSELAKISTELQDKANIPVEERFKFVKMYNGSNNEALLLENLSKQGFQTFGKMDVLMELRYVELCLEQLARFHGVAFVIERKMPEYYTSEIKSLKQSLVLDDAYKVFANKLYKHSTKKLSFDLKIKVDRWWETAFENYSKYMHGTITDVKCLCHGDFKTNNVMFKETDGKISKVIAVDYQLAHYGSPILDIIYFICMGTDKKFRKKHLTHLKDYYHVSLRKYLEYFDVLVEDVYPRNQFEKDFKDCLDYALLSCILVLPITLNEEDGNPDLVDSKIFPVGLTFRDSYYDRLKGMFDDFFNL